MSPAASVAREPSESEDHALRLHVKEEPETSEAAECVKENADTETHVKQEPWESECGVSEAAMLFTYDVVKEELELGPELVHHPSEPDALCTTNQATATVHMRSGLSLRKCFVRLERIPLEAALVRPTAGQQARHPGATDWQTHTDTRDIQAYVCDTCSTTFKQKLKLIQHIRLHMLKEGNPKLGHKQGNACNTCGLSFESGCRHTGKPYTCEICGKQFTQSSHLGRHKRVHTGKLYSCDICKKKYTRLNNLRSHKWIHKGQNSNSCDKQCHTGEKPYYCDICMKGFTRLYSLKAHKRIHTGEKPYSCGICQKRFTRLNNIKRHKRTHTGEMSYYCEICKNKFTRMSNFKEHKRIHSGEKPYSCEVCKRCFTRLSTLKTHEQKFHFPNK